MAGGEARQRILIDVLMKSKQARDGFMKLEKNAANFERTINRAQVRANRFTNAIAEGLRTGQQEAIGFNGALLSMMFLGMQMNMIFSRALTSVFEGYKKIIPESSKFNQMTTKLSANWEFFKFQLAEALAQSTVFQKFVQFSINLLQQFQKLPQPVKTLIGVLLAVGAVLGTILFSVGSIGLGMAGVIDFATALKSKLMGLGDPIKSASDSTTVLAGDMESAKKKTKSFKNVWAGAFKKTGLLFVIAGAGILLGKLVQVNAESDTMRKKWKQLNDAGLGLLNALIPMSESLDSVGQFMIAVSFVSSRIVAIFGKIAAITVGIIKGLGALAGFLVGALVVSIKSAIKSFTALGEAMAGDTEEAKKIIQEVGKSHEDLGKSIKNTASDILKETKKNVDAFDDARMTTEELKKAFEEYGEAAKKANKDAADVPKNLQPGNLLAEARGKKMSISDIAPEQPSPKFGTQQTTNEVTVYNINGEEFRQEIESNRGKIKNDLSDIEEKTGIDLTNGVS